MSAESGIPTFRGRGGLWRQFRAEDLATPEAFARNPTLVWEWYDWRRARVANAEPHEGHRAISEIEALAGGATVVTQNVDGLHRRAGSGRVIELHGNILRARCVRDGAPREDLAVPLGEIPPRCDCGALLRPDVVWFGERLPEGRLEEALDAVLGADILFVVGTSAVVQPAASLAFAATSRGGTVVEVNPEETPLTPHVEFRFSERAGCFLPRLRDVLRPGESGGGLINSWGRG